MLEVRASPSCPEGICPGGISLRGFVSEGLSEYLGCKCPRGIYACVECLGCMSRGFNVLEW